MPIYRQRRRPYLIIGWGFVAGAMAGLAAVGKPSFAMLMAFVRIRLSCMLSVSSWHQHIYHAYRMLSVSSCHPHWNPYAARLHLFINNPIRPSLNPHDYRSSSPPWADN